ncbi:MAG: aminomethyl transferase family protein, partial [Chloroflexi bacterium]|nr:aminomethyl transferase family protein [Chloroflexota bacterium]
GEGRPARISPLYEKLKSKGCIFTEGFGWERAKWFSLDGRVEDHSFRRNNIFEVIGAECRAVRERVGIFELPSFAKFDLTGKDVEVFLNRLTANRVSQQNDGIVLAHALTESGRISTEFTITRLASDHFYLLSGAYAYQRDLDLLRFSKRADEDVTVTDITNDYSILILAGPHARSVLSKLTSADLSNAAFRWLTGKEIDVAGIRVRALRVNYVGELGWELHVPMNRVVALYDAVWAAGEELGIADFGLYAMNSLRMEKAYAGWGAELTNEVTPIEAGLDRFVKLDKDFVGRAAVLKAKESGVAFKLVYVEVDAKNADVFGGEPVYAGEKVIGVATSGGYGHIVGKSLAFVYVNPGYDAPGAQLSIDILGERCTARVLAKPVYDPENLRLRA